MLFGNFINWPNGTIVQDLPKYIRIRFHLWRESTLSISCSRSAKETFAKLHIVARIGAMRVQMSRVLLDNDAYFCRLVTNGFVRIRTQFLFSVVVREIRDIGKSLRSLFVFVSSFICCFSHGETQKAWRMQCFSTRPNFLTRVRPCVSTGSASCNHENNSTSQPSTICQNGNQFIFLNKL